MSAIVSSVQDTPTNSLVRRLWRGLLRVKLVLVDRRRYERIALEEVCGVPLIVLPDVFNPKLLRSGEFLVSTLERMPLAGRMLDLGCGSGAAGVFAARLGCEVVAVDINPSAVRCTQINALLNNVDIEIRQGDLFQPVESEQFDGVFFNPPYYRGVPRDALDHAWRSPDMPDRFASGLAAHLRPDGSALVVLSSDGDGSAFLAALEARGFHTEVAATHDFINEVMTVYRVRPC